MALVDLASHSNGRPVALADISQRQEISLSYLEQLFAKLRRNGLVKSVRGPGGGYLLSRSAEDTRISDAIMAVDEPIRATRCKPNTGDRLPERQEPLPDPRFVGRADASDPPVPELGFARGCRQPAHPRQVAARPAAGDRRRRRRRPAPARSRCAPTSRRSSDRSAMSNAIYMDANATTPPSASALAALEAALRVTGNPSSVHGFGRAARGLVDRARVQVAQLVGAKAENVIFVAGGTEANNLALASRGSRPLIVSGIEHELVLKPAGSAGARILRDSAQRPGRSRRPRRGASRSRAAGVRVDHAGEQRNRRDPAGARGRGAGACGRRTAALRRIAGAGADRT